MAADEYALPPDDPCHSTVAAFQQITGAGVDAYWQALQYQRYRPRLEAGQKCCPALREKAAALQPAITDPTALNTTTFPAEAAIFAKDGLCAGVIPFKSTKGDSAALIQGWYRQYNRERAAAWDEAYAGLSNELQACCRQRLSKCLADVPTGSSHPAAADRCRVRFAPPEIPLPTLEEAAVPPPGADPAATAAAAKKLSEAAFASAAPLRAQACREQLRHFMNTATSVVLDCTTDAQGQRHCTSETVQRAEQAEALRDRFMQESREQQAEIGRLQGELQAVPAVRPGRELLAALPDGPGGGSCSPWQEVPSLACSLSSASSRCCRTRVGPTSSSPSPVRCLRPRSSPCCA